MVKAGFLRRNAALAALVVAATVGSQSAEATATCKTLSDNDNEFITSLLELITGDSSLASTLPLADMYGELDEALPWLSTCTAAINIQTVMTSVGSSKSLQKCLTEIEDVDMSEDDFDKLLTKTVCPLFKDKIVSCVQTAVKDELVYTMENTNGCCDAFQAKIKTLFTDDIETMINKLLLFAGNVMCSERTYKNLKGTSVTESCGYSIINSFGNFETADITDIVQIPNAGMCSAFEGKTFTNTKGATSQFAFNTDDVDSMGICLQPIDELIQHISTWPIFDISLDAGSKGKFTLSSLFTSGESIKGNVLVAWAIKTDNLPMILARTVDNVASAFSDSSSSGSVSSSSGDAMWGDYATLEALLTALGNEYMSEMGAFKVHIPNNGDCTYSTQSLSEPYSSASTGASNGASDSSVSIKAAAALALLSTAMMLA